MTEPSMSLVERLRAWPKSTNVNPIPLLLEAADRIEELGTLLEAQQGRAVVAELDRDALEEALRDLLASATFPNRPYLLNCKPSVVQRAQALAPDTASEGSA